jgi:hypothetical protein
MADVYRIGVAIGMTDNASQVLQALGKSLLGLNLKIKDIEGGFGRIKLAALGLVGVLGGREMLRGINALAEAGAKLQSAQTAMAQAGMTARQITEATNVSYRSLGQVRGLDMAERLDAYRELRGILGPRGDDFSEVQQVLPSYLKLHTLYGGRTQDVMRAVEMQGGVQFDRNGQFDQSRFGTYLDAAVRTLQASGGTIKPQDLLNVMKQASVTARGMDPNAFWNLMMTPIMEMGGYRAGTALSAFSRQFYGGIMPERNARELQSLGLMQAGKATYGHDGRLIAGRGAITSEDVLNDPNRGPLSWLAETALPAFRQGFAAFQQSHPGTKETWQAYVRDEVTRVFSTETDRRLAALVLTQLGSVQRDQALRQSAPGVGAYDLAQHNYETQLENLRKSWASLMQTLGLPAARDAASVLRAVGGGIDALTQAARRHPALARDIERLAAAIAVLGIASGSAAIIGAAFGPLAKGLGLLRTVMVGGEMAAATAALPGLAAGLGPVAVGLTALAAAVTGLPLLLKGASDWIDQHLGIKPSQNGFDAKYGNMHSHRDPNAAPADPHQSGSTWLWDHMKRGWHAASPNGLFDFGQGHNHNMRSGGKITPTADFGGDTIQPIHISLQLDGREIARATHQHTARRAARDDRASGGLIDPMGTFLPPGRAVAL